MNLYEYSQQNNIEYGIVFEKEVDVYLFGELVEEVNRIIFSSDFFELLSVNNEQ